MAAIEPTSPQALVIALRRSKAIKLRAQGKTYEEIAAVPDLGYTSRQHARDDVVRGLRELAAERAEDGAVAVEAEVQKLERIEAKLMAIMDSHGLTIRNGEVVTFQGEAVIDFGPAMQAAKILLDLQQRRARLLGLDQPVKADVGGEINMNVRYEYAGIDPEDV